MQANQSSVIWAVVICAIVLLVVGLFSVGSVNSNLKLVGEKVDGIDIDEDTIVSEVLAGIEIPEIEVQEMPDTLYSIEDEKKSLAEDLAIEELDEKDVKKFIADKIDLGCGSDVDIEYKDITQISVKDVIDTKLSGSDEETAKVTIELKVYFDNYGDEDETESARIDLKFTVNDLVRDDDNDGDDME